MDATKLIIMVFMACSTRLAHCTPKMDYLSAFDSFEIAKEYVKFSPKSNQFLIENLGFGPFGASGVNVTLQNVSPNVKGSIIFKTEGQTTIASVLVSTRNELSGPVENSNLIGVRNLYIVLPPYLTPYNFLSFSFTPIKSPPENQWYSLINAESFKALTNVVEPTKWADTEIFTAKYNQIFRFEKSNGDFYKIIDKRQKELRAYNNKNDDNVVTSLWTLNVFTPNFVRIVTKTKGQDLCINEHTTHSLCSDGNGFFWWIIPLN